MVFPPFGFLLFFDTQYTLDTGCQRAFRYSGRYAARYTKLPWSLL